VDLARDVTTGKEDAPPAAQVQAASTTRRLLESAMSGEEITRSWPS
jgi:hypothetical protein